MNNKLLVRTLLWYGSFGKKTRANVTG